MLIDENGMIVVHNEKELAKTVIQFFNEPGYRKKVGENAYSVVEENRGSLQKQLNLIKAIL